MEAMVTLALIAITLSLAIPSYRAYVVRSNRSEALEALMTAAACQERVYIASNAYNADACGGASDNGTYTVTIATSNGNQNFVATATPQGAQAEDNCAALTLDHTGAKTANGQGGDFARSCWTGRHASGGS